MELYGLFQDIALTMCNGGSCKKLYYFVSSQQYIKGIYLLSNECMIQIFLNAQKLPLENETTNSAGGICAAFSEKFEDVFLGGIAIWTQAGHSESPHLWWLCCREHRGPELCWELQAITEGSDSKPRDLSQPCACSQGSNSIPSHWSTAPISVQQWGKCSLLAGSPGLLAGPGRALCAAGTICHCC